MKYPVKITKSSSNHLITSRHFGAVNTISTSLDDALNDALSIIKVEFMQSMVEKKSIPIPDFKLEDEQYIHIPLNIAAKVYLFNALLELNVSDVELSNRMQLSVAEVGHLYSLEYTTKFNVLEKAFRVLGLELALHVEKLIA